MYQSYQIPWFEVIEGYLFEVLDVDCGVVFIEGKKGFLGSSSDSVSISDSEDELSLLSSHLSLLLLSYYFKRDLCTLRERRRCLSFLRRRAFSSWASFILEESNETILLEERDDLTAPVGISVTRSANACARTRG